MIMNFQCSICGKVFRCNGSNKAFHLQLEHLKNNHTKEIKLFIETRNEIQRIKKEVIKPLIEKVSYYGEDDMLGNSLT